MEFKRCVLRFVRRVVDVSVVSISHGGRDECCVATVHGLGCRCVVSDALPVFAGRCGHRESRLHEIKRILNISKDVRYGR